MDVENGFEGGGKLICKVGCVGCWVCVERGSEDVTFEVLNINFFVGPINRAHKARQEPRGIMKLLANHKFLA